MGYTRAMTDIGIVNRIVGPRACVVKYMDSNRGTGLMFSKKSIWGWSMSKIHRGYVLLMFNHTNLASPTYNINFANIELPSDIKTTSRILFTSKLGWIDMLGIIKSLCEVKISSDGKSARVIGYGATVRYHSKNNLKISLNSDEDDIKDACSEIEKVFPGVKDRGIRDICIPFVSDFSYFMYQLYGWAQSERANPSSGGTDTEDEIKCI